MSEKPCGCKDDKMSKTTRVKMKFIGRKPDGQLMKGAPGAPYEQGKIYEVPLSLSKWPWWEMQDILPSIKAPEPLPSDSVFQPVTPVAPPAPDMASSSPPEAQESSTSDPGELTQSTPDEKDEMPEWLKADLKSMGDGEVGGGPAKKRRGRPKAPEPEK